MERFCCCIVCCISCITWKNINTTSTVAAAAGGGGGGGGVEIGACRGEGRGVWNHEPWGHGAVGGGSSQAEVSGRILGKQEVLLLLLLLQELLLVQVLLLLLQLLQLNGFCLFLQLLHQHNSFVPVALTT
jgi:hypothetical protein